MNALLLKYFDIYQVAENDNIKFGIEIREAQGGIIDIALDGKVIVKKRHFKVEPFELKRGVDLKVKLLNFMAVVDDVIESHDNASITYRFFKNGQLDFENTRPYVFVDGQNTVIFRIQVKFE